MKIMKKLNIEIILFSFGIFCYFISKVNSFTRFRAFNLYSENLLLITNEGIKLYDTSFETIIDIINITIIPDNFFFSSFVQFPLSQGGYILLKLMNNIYLLNKEANEVISQDTKNEINGIYSKLIPYKSQNNKLYCFISFVENYKLKIFAYKIENSKLEFDYEIIREETQINFQQNSVSCEIMFSSFNQNNSSLICFTSDKNTHKLIVTSFNPENNLSYIYSLANDVTNLELNFIKSCTSKNKLIAFICFSQELFNPKCVLYDSKNNIWSEHITLASTISIAYDLDINYSIDNNEYYLYFYYEYNVLYFFKFDQFFNLKCSNEEKCIYTYEIKCGNSEYSSSFICNKGKYKLYLSCQYDYILEKIDLNGENNAVFEYTKFNISKNSLLYSTILFLSTNSSSDSDTILSTSLLSDSIILPSSLSTSLISPTSPSTSLIQLYSSSLSVSTYSSLFEATPSLLISSSIKKANYIDYDDYDNKDGIKMKITNKTKNEIKGNLSNIIDEIEVGQKYKINGDDYNIIISPIKMTNTFKSTYIEFSLCEHILRKHYNLSSTEILTVLQIEIEDKNEKVLTSQVEYEIYNEKKEKLNLSYCHDVEIKVNYEIKNVRLINKTMIQHYSNLGIDIFNSEDLFFNEVCYPFSISNSDVILKDRIIDIYQNFSLCENECKYEFIDIERMYIRCSCQVKEEINFEPSKPVFTKVVKETFENSNFGVIRCFAIVFNLNNKVNNIGFFLFLIIILVHLPLFIYYFIYGTQSIVSFVYKDMNKYNYISKYKASPLKKKKNSKIVNNAKNNSSNEAISNNDNKITIINYQNNNNYLIDSQKHAFKVTNEKNTIFRRRNKKSKTTMGLKNRKNLNENIIEPKFPGFYNLIQIDANNSLNDEPPDSKYILDNYDYDTALKYEKRSIGRIYYICLLSKTNILNTFYFKSNLETQAIRLTLFIFNYSCDCCLNALFYLNQKISDKYHYEGNSLYTFTLINNSTITIFSTFLGFLLVLLLGLLTNSKDEIKDIFKKEEKKLRKNKRYKVNKTRKKIINNRLISIFKILKIKIGFYILIESLFMLFFFYYITAFCGVYQNTQISWVLDCIASCFISFIYEILYSFVISILYITSLKFKLRSLYNISLFFYDLG